jgi:chromosomal replication initiation ATPase DnaA
MDENKDLELLLKNLQEGLKNHSIKELNEALVVAINNKYDKKADIDNVLLLVSKKYEISIKTLLSTHGRGKTQEAKQIAYCLLHINLGLSIRYIAKRVFFNWPSSVMIGVKRYKFANPKIKHDAEFLETYNNLQEKLMMYLSTKIV